MNMTLNDRHSFTADSAVDEAIELQLGFHNQAAPGYAGRTIYRLTAWRNDRNLVSYSLKSQSDQQCSLSNVQSRHFFPGKAVAGWQLHVIEWARASQVYEIQGIQ